MSSIRNTSEKKSRRNRECFMCASNIKQGETYKNVEIRYDTTIFSLYRHIECKSKESLLTANSFIRELEKESNVKFNCNHRFVRTTRNYKRVRKCLDCGFIKEAIPNHPGNKIFITEI